MVQDLESGDDKVGIKPFGALVERLTDTGTNWQIYKELIDASGRAWSRIYNGQDGSMGTNSSAPGVSLEALFGVKSDIVEGDLGAMDRGLNEGAIQIWCALNFADSSLAPIHEHLMPDQDEDARRMSEAERGAAFFAEMRAARDAGFTLDPVWVAGRAKEYGITAPTSPTPAPVGAAPSAAGSGVAAPPVVPPAGAQPPPSRLSRLAPVRG